MDDSKLSYYEAMTNWVTACRESRDNKELELINNGVAPDFTWAEPPLKENYNI